jgi:hypothetical protein
MVGLAESESMASQSQINDDKQGHGIPWLGRWRWLGIVLALPLAAVLLAVSWRCVLPPPSPEPETVPAASLSATTLQEARPSPDDAASITAPRVAEQWRADDETFDPTSDGWESESFAATAESQLSKVVDLLTQPGRISAEQLAEYLAADFSASSLRPDELQTVFEDDSVLIRRQAARLTETRAGQYHGAQGLAEAFQRLADPFGDASEIQVHLKIYGVAASPSDTTTTADLEVDGRTKEGTVQQNSTWICRWTRPPGGLPPRLQSIRLEDYEEVVGRAGGGTWFVDCTESALAHNRSFHDQVVLGLNHWLQRIEHVHGIQVYSRMGLAVGDVNGDGLDDVYLCQPGGLPNRLFIQNADGTASDQSAWAGVDWLDHTSSALLVDLDNDGDQDLALATTAGILIMENDTSGRFRLRATLHADRSAESLSAADYDNDGDLDIYVCVYRSNPETKLEGANEPFVYHDANNGGMNRMFRNDIRTSPSSTWQLTDVTRQCGLDEANRRWSLAAAWEDYDNDGDQDLYVANDYGRNCLYRNDGGKFVDVAEQAGVIDSGSGMSVSWGDINHDGWMDLFVGNMFSSAGSRIATQAAFRPGTDEATRELYRRFAKGNSLFQNVDGARFREIGAEASVEMARWAWSSLLVDINNDGWHDAFVGNGFITADDSRDL